MLLHKTLRSAMIDWENLIPFTTCVQPKDREDDNDDKEGEIGRFKGVMDGMVVDFLGLLVQRW